MTFYCLTGNLCYSEISPFISAILPIRVPPWLFRLVCLESSNLFNSLHSPYTNSSLPFLRRISPYDVCFKFHFLRLKTRIQCHLFSLASMSPVLRGKTQNISQNSVLSLVLFIHLIPHLQSFNHSFIQLVAY